MTPMRILIVLEHSGQWQDRQRGHQARATQRRIGQLERHTALSGQGLEKPGPE